MGPLIVTTKNEPSHCGMTAYRASITSASHPKFVRDMVISIILDEKWRLQIDMAFTGLRTNRQRVQKIFQPIEDEGCQHIKRVL